MHIGVERLHKRLAEVRRGIVDQFGVPVKADELEVLEIRVLKRGDGFVDEPLHDRFTALQRIEADGSAAVQRTENRCGRAGIGDGHQHGKLEVVAQVQFGLDVADETVERGHIDVLRRADGIFQIMLPAALLHQRMLAVGPGVEREKERRIEHRIEQGFVFVDVSDIRQQLVICILADIRLHAVIIGVVVNQNAVGNAAERFDVVRRICVPIFDFLLDVGRFFAAVGCAAEHLDLVDKAVDVRRKDQPHIARLIAVALIGMDDAPVRRAGDHFLVLPAMDQIEGLPVHRNREFDIARKVNARAKPRKLPHLIAGDSHLLAQINGHAGKDAAVKLHPVRVADHVRSGLAVGKLAIIREHLIRERVFDGSLGKHGIGFSLRDVRLLRRGRRQRGGKQRQADEQRQQSSSHRYRPHQVKLSLYCCSVFSIAVVTADSICCHEEISVLSASLLMTLPYRPESVPQVKMEPRS